MKDRLEAALKGLGQRFGDGRLHVFDLSVSKIEQHTAFLCGRILEQTDLDHLCERLAGQFPALRLDTGNVRVLHRSDNPALAVGVNLTGVYAEKSFHSEQVNQAWYGERFEILEQDDRWAFARQEDGYLGYTYLPYLTGKIIPPPTHLVTAPAAALHEAPQPRSAILTRVLSGAAVRLEAVEGEWAKIAANRCGWLPLADLRALDSLRKEEAELRAQMAQDALRLTGVPYQWGGITANGIDCSGFARLVHRWAGVSIPRDADLQYCAGRPVEPPFRPGDLVFFGEASGKKIAHVAISLGGWEIIHASLARNGVYPDNIQAVERLRESLAGGCSFL